ncbi:MAG: hypothetical protein QOI00_566 [Chloroflexota bacterium]|nr:hypothetical protein [Chloroflexota bacterium]
MEQQHTSEAAVAMSFDSSPNAVRRRGSRGAWALARPTGVGRALATYELRIEGRDEWVAAARRLA